MREGLRRVVIAYETEAAAQARLAGLGFPAEVAAEIAVYLAQATDLPEHMAAIREALKDAGVAAEFVELNALAERLASLGAAPAGTMLWSLTDGFRYYRGSAVPALARLIGAARFGSPATAQHICQDKFASLCLAAAAGLRCPPTLLLEGSTELARLGGEPGDGPFFVKPNRLGAKIGIFADSRCATLAEARERAAKLWARYGDRAVVEPYLPGADVRVSFLDLGRSLRDQLGIFRLQTDRGGETGGEFMTMRDNQTLSGASDTAGGRGGFGAARPAAFTPRLVDIRSETGPPAQAAVAAVADATERLARLLGLTDYFSLDFRLPADGAPWFLEFEVCPAVTIYDFRTYLRAVHGLELGPALARAMRLAWQRRGGTDEA
jgi:D-alanine-D-alanine ligase